jgi:hypothetical protein
MNKILRILLKFLIGRFKIIRNKSNKIQILKRNTVKFLDLIIKKLDKIKSELNDIE